MPRNKERWKLVPSLDGEYEVSSFGRFRRAKPGLGTWVGRIVGPKIPSVNRYVYFATRPAHCWVAEAFLGPRPKGYEVNHKDLIKWRNIWTNLEYVTPKRNKRHAIERGVKYGTASSKYGDCKGSASGMAKLNEESVRIIKKRLAKGWKARKLGEEFGVTEGAILHIKWGMTWRHVNV